MSGPPRQAGLGPAGRCYGCRGGKETPATTQITSPCGAGQGSLGAWLSLAICFPLGTFREKFPFLPCSQQLFDEPGARTRGESLFLLPVSQAPSFGAVSYRGGICCILSQLHKPSLPRVLRAPHHARSCWSGVNCSVLLRAQQRCLHLPAGSGAQCNINYSLQGGIRGIL